VRPWVFRVRGGGLGVDHARMKELGCGQGGLWRGSGCGGESDLAWCVIS
jgi:hypothetical protein